MLKKIKKSVLTLVAMSALYAHAGQVSVSNYPLYLLSQEVTKGTHDAQVLLSAGDVGHHGSLSPAKTKLVKDSQFVVWFGEELEQNLVNTLSNAPNAISLFKMNAFHRLPLRDVDGNPKPDSLDPHIWLDPANARAIVAALVVIHSHAHPESAAVFKQNAQDFFAAQKKLPKLTGTKPYWAYHDSFQYLERSAGLKFTGALTPDHHLAPKASRFKILNQNRPAKTMCLASQTAVSEGIKTKLDPIKVLVRQEDMSDETSFLKAMQGLLEDFKTCTD